MSLSEAQALKASLHARLRRHERVFGKNSIVALAWRKSQTVALKTGAAALKYSGVGFIWHTAGVLKERYDARTVAPTPATLFRRLSAVTLTMLVTTVVLGSTLDVSYASYGNDEYFNQITQEGTLIADSEGYFSKASPQTSTAKTERTFKDRAIYTIESGDTLSTVAARFNVKSETLMWENDVTMASVLKIGQKLSIPPANGVSHRVASGQSVEKIASLYKVEAQKIVAMNNLESGTLSAGQVIFVPEGRPLPSIRTVAQAARSASRDAPSRNAQRKLENTTTAPAAGKFLIFPTIGSITQGFRSGHYAYDIGNRTKPPIWAAAEGTVIKASQGGWGGGYGNHVIVDHGNGVKTLYAHMDHLVVKNGDHVSQGEVIGQMGNTGRVRGATGIHLHFEVIDHGVKKVPGRYY